MKTKLTFKTLITAILFIGINTAVLAISAPEVSKEDASLSFWDMSLLDQAYINTSPGLRNDNIEVGSLGGKIGNKEPIVKLATEIANNQYGTYDSLLISHNDKLIFESYYNKGRVDLPQFQFSVSKTYIALAIGRAIQLGHLTMADLNKPISQFFDDLDSKKLARGIQHITLHQVLTMRSGITLDDEIRTQILDSITQSKGTKGTNIVQALLQHSNAITAASQTMVYKDADPIFAMSILEAVVPGTAEEFINAELLTKIGITDFRWNKDINGLPTGTGAYLTPRNMLKIGALMLNKGQWRGKQLVSEEYFKQATQGIAQPNEAWIPESYQYGYFMYQIDMQAGKKHYSANLAWGAGGQRILTIEELELVVVITGHDIEDKIMPNLIQAILRAFSNFPAA